MRIIKKLTIRGIVCSLVLLTTAPSLLANVASGTNYALESYTTPTGAGVRSSTNYTVDYTVGQSVAGAPMYGNNYVAETGYQMSYAITPEPPDHGAAVDMDISTLDYDQSSVTSQDIEPAISAEVDDVITIALVAQNVEDLDTYQVEIQFDITKLAFVAGYEDNPLGGITNLLKKNGGTTIWMPVTQPSPGVVNIANSMVGTDPATAPEGSGVIGLLQFRVLQTTEPNNLTLDNVHFVNVSGRDYTVTNLVQGSVILEPQDLMGDVDGSTNVELNDSILSLQVLSGEDVGELNLNSDVNGDQRIGVEEAIYILKEVSKR